MKLRFLLSIPWLIFAALMIDLSSGCTDNLNVLLVTGGHSYDTTEFFNLFRSYEGISVDTISQPGANMLLEENNNDYDVIVFYDMWQDITPAQKDAYLSLLDVGTGIIFLHHSLVSYQDWDELGNIRGGKYRERGYGADSSKFSGYEHGLDLQVKVLDQNHPVTKDMQDFQIYDEGYYNLEMLPDIVPLLQTSHPLCASYVAWTNEYKQSRIVYIMLGHDRQAYENFSFRQLIGNAIHWAGKGR